MRLLVRACRRLGGRRAVVGSLLAVLLVAAGLALAEPRPGPALVRSWVLGQVRVWLVHYRAHDGQLRRAYFVLPRWYGPKNDPRLPLIISPHGRGSTALANSAVWGDLPARDRFAVVNPEGQGRRLVLYSWGDPGQIADLARMPDVVRRALPWVRIDRRRVYAVGASMGGQEVLLLLARYPRLLAGVAAFDAPTDLGRRYRAFVRLGCDRACRRLWRTPRRGGLSFGEQIQRLAVLEIGGTPETAPAAYARRSPLSYARRLAFSAVPLQLWWSRRDRVVIDQHDQSGRLFRLIKRLNPAAPVVAFVGRWSHASEMTYRGKLPAALARFGLHPRPYDRHRLTLRARA